MSLMNVLSVTLIVLILGAGLALFLGMRSAQANSYATPLQIQVPSPIAVEAVAMPDTMDAPSISPRPDAY